ncbi:MAG: M14 family metallopeptidase [Tenacibaculum sp.]|nr:M14 family metallopeptidase [Tenacibaculum sp.]
MRYIISVILLLSYFQINGQSSFYFFGEEVKPGTKKHFEIPISNDNNSTTIPITVFCGIQDGKTLGITAGIHGYEYPPIIAGQKLIKSINPKSLKGVVILVQIANIASFQKRSPFVNPIDNKNLNRMFPGKKNGTISERIANFITKEVISKSDYFLDIHGGDASEDLMSYSAYYSNSSFPNTSLEGKKMAESLLFENIVVFDTNGKSYMKKSLPSLYCSAEAFKRGIPSVDIECGGLGKAENKSINQIESGVLNLINHLDMTIDTSNPKFNPYYNYINERAYHKSSYNGIFYANKKAGDFVSKGMKVGNITDYFGNIQETINAKSDGIILIITGTPPVNKNETILVLGKSSSINPKK